MWNYVDVLEKSAITGVITGLASAVTTGYKLRVPVMGRPVPLVVFTALAGAVSSVLIDCVHKLIKKEIPLNKKAQDEASLYLGAIIGACSYWGIITMYNGYLTRDMGTYTLLLTGAGAETAGSLAFNMLRG